LDFSDDGNLLVTASNDDTIHLYDVNKAQYTQHFLISSLEKEVHSKKYGVSKINFTHSNSCVISASRNEFDHTIRYHSLHDNKYLCYYKGHRESVISLCMSPQNDTFASASLDETVKLWDLKSPTLIASLPVKGKPQVAIDPSSKVIATTTPTAMRLYDIRMTDKGPFVGCQIESSNAVTGIKFGPRGNTIMTSSNDCVTVYDAMKLTKMRDFTEFANESNLPIESSYTPDEEYVLCGSEDGGIYAWEIESGKRVAYLEGHAGPVLCVKFNPRLMEMASSCTAVSLWTPSQIKNN
jgi:COMPASS component SWD2